MSTKNKLNNKVFPSTSESLRGDSGETRLNNKGFTILELIVVILIISMGLVGVLSLIVQNVQVQYVNKNELIASQLAQEGLEIIRNKRDTNWKIGGATPWNSGIAEGTYEVDYTGIYNYISGKLYLDSNGFYIHTASASSTPFKRTITTTGALSTASSSAVTCVVTWQDKGGTKSYEADTVLYNWKQ